MADAEKQLKELFAKEQNLIDEAKAKGNPDAVVIQGMWNGFARMVNEMCQRDNPDFDIREK